MSAGYKLTKRQKVYLPVKRAVDIFGALLAIVLLSWILLICAIITKCTSRGPVLFKQPREGKNLKIFKCYKFRSMKVGVAQKGAEDISEEERKKMVTKWGHIMRKTSLDELPQLFNILGGSMSFIGPRPDMITESNNELKQLRLSYSPNAYDVKPGLSGYAQIYLNREHDPKKKAEFDAYYAKNFGIWMDIKLFFLSFLVLFGYKPGR